jgi:acetaldehyde dehydrogenase
MSTDPGRVRVAIIGTGNIGTDLMYKVERSDYLELVGVAGIDPDSDGLRTAIERGHLGSSGGLRGLLDMSEDFDLAFDATSAYAHAEHARLLLERGIRSVDLTPASLGPAVVPTVNLIAHQDSPDVSLITCGAQATIPIVAAISSVVVVEYAETVSTIASKSAGHGTRQNIDEFTYATARGLESIGGATTAKAIIVLNPADPPPLMRNTIYVSVGDAPAEVIASAVREAVAQVAVYVPGYRLVGEPQVREGLTTVMVEVEGAADYLPAYAGNLDIMTSAAVRVAELHRGGAK